MTALKTKSFLLVATLSVALGACGTLTGIPGHGGGKRFTEEQRLVASSIRLAVKHIDVKKLKSKNVAIVFGLISDEGGGNIVGGRASITAVLTQGQVTVPSTSSSSSVDIFQLATGTTSTSNTTGTASGTNVTSGTSETTNSSNTSSTSNTSTTDNTTADTTSAFSTSANQTTTTTSSGTSTGTGSSTTTTTSNENQNSNTASTSTSESSQTNTTSGTTEQAIVTGTTTSASGNQSQTNVGITYEGLGQYQNLAVPKSDASYLMSEVRNHFILNGVQIRAPDDPATEVFVYVSVPILGLNRSRTDLVLYNQEDLRAETYIEVFAIDRSGLVIMKPQIGNFQTFYKEQYIAWSGPFNTRRGAEPGLGLIEEEGEKHDGFTLP